MRMNRMMAIFLMCFVVFSTTACFSATIVISTVTWVPQFSPLTQPREGSLIRYWIHFSVIKNVDDGVLPDNLPDFYSKHHIVAVPAGAPGHFWLLTRSHGVACAFSFSVADPWRCKLARKFPDSIVPYNLKSSPIRVGSDGTVWVCLVNPKLGRYTLEMFNAQLTKTLGAYVLPAKMVLSEMALVGRTAVVFGGAGARGAPPGYVIWVVQENGKVLHTMNVVGHWPPENLFVAGRVILGTENGRRGLIEFTLDKDLHIKLLRRLHLPDSSIIPSAALDARTGVCVLWTHPNAPGEEQREIGLMSLTTGKVLKAVPINFSVSHLLVAPGNILAISLHGTIHVFTRDLKLVSTQSVLPGYPERATVSVSP